MCNFITKAVLGVVFMIWLRWTLPRLRIDQVMTTCLKYCVPLGSAMLAGVMLWMYFLPDGAIAELRRAYRGRPRRTEPRGTGRQERRREAIANCKVSRSSTPHLKGEESVSRLALREQPGSGTPVCD